MSANRQIDLLLRAACRKQADELRVRTGQPPMLYCGDQFKKVNSAPVTPEQLAILLKSVAPDDAQQSIATKGQAKFYVDFQATRLFVLAAQSDQAIDIRIRRCH